MIPSPQEITYFVELCNTLNFSRASERIGISQPSLSNAIKRLEQTLKVSLFNRSKTGVSLTPAGKTFLAHTKSLLQLWDDVAHKTLGAHEEIQGHFSLGCHPAIAVHSLSGFLPTLMNAHPQLEIEFKHDLSRKILEGVINFSIDIGIVVNPLKHPDIIIHKLYDDQVTFWSAPYYSVKLGDAPIICDPELTQTQVLLKKLHQQNTHYPRLITSSCLEVIANLTATGAGIGLLPTTIANSAYSHKLKFIKHAPIHKDEICLVYRHENRFVKALQLIVIFIKNHYKIG